MPKRLIVNADDYGRTASVSRGIRQAHLQGIVTTTTAMMNFPTAQDDLRVVMAECPQLGLGVHLVLTAGRPVLPPEQVRSLVTGHGGFPQLSRFEETASQMDPAELQAEWRAQIEKFLATGAALDHIDSHHHSSYFTETSMGVMLDLANEYHAPVRNPLSVTEDSGRIANHARRLLAEKKTPCPTYFYTSFYDNGITLQNLLAILNSLSDGIAEIMCHPGFVDEDISNNSSYNWQREAEVKVLTAVEVKNAILEHKLELTTFRAVI